MRIDRLLSITIMLLNRNKITARELADYFEVSVRTIYRDIEAINLAGIPIISYQGFSGGFGIMENFKIDRQVLSMNDIRSMLSTLKGINSTLEDRELDMAIEKMTNLLPRHENKPANSRFERFAVDITPWGSSEQEKQKLKLIHEAITKNIIIRFHYRNTKGEYTLRETEPMTLLFKAFYWYVFAFCLKRKDFRLFRVSRIHNLEFTNREFMRRNVSYTDYMEPESDSRKTVRLKLKFSPRSRYRVDDYFDENHIQVLKGGYTVVEVDYPEDQWIYSFILSFGEDIEVLEPDRIKKNVLKKIDKIKKNYKPDI